MSLRPHGRAAINAKNPRALAVCDRCGFLYQHDVLRWQYQYRGPRTQNIRLLVCPSDYDILQEQLRTFILPQDPISISNSRMEDYAGADNPVHTLGYDPANMFNPTAQRGENIGNLTLGAGVNAAFDGWLAGGFPAARTSPIATHPSTTG